MNKLDDIKLEFNQRPQLRKHQIKWLIEQAEKVEQYEKALLKIKDLYNSDDENKLDNFLYGLFTNEIYDDSY
jgi:hypothetical protein